MRIHSYAQNYFIRLFARVLEIPCPTYLNHPPFSREDKTWIEIASSFFFSPIRYKRERNELSTRIKLMLNVVAHKHVSNLEELVRERDEDRAQREQAGDT